MNCPSCGESLSCVPGAGYAAGVETWMCPSCELANVARSPALADPEADTVAEYRRHATPEQLQELLESCPADVAALQALLCLLWSHHCWVMRLLIKGEASPASLVALALARSDVVAAIRAVLAKGGAK